MADYKLYPQTTPVKKTQPPPYNRRQMSDIVTRTDYLTPQKAFSVDRLNKPPSFAAILENKTLQGLVKQFSSSTTTSYGLVVKLLNCASSLIHKRWAKDKELLAFRDNHTRSPTNHPNDSRAGEPDIVTILDLINKLIEKDKTKRIPWHHVLSTIEEKGEADSDDGPAQSAAYLAFANQCRPDLVGMYGMAILPKGYIVQYSCPAGLQTSEEFNWVDITPLLSYVYTLYIPRKDFASRDPSITLADSDDTFGAPAWNIRDGDKVYENCAVKVVGDPWRRMTWVARVGTSPITIKDSYRDAHASFREGELYDILHREGPAPGFLRIKKEYEVRCERGRPITVTVGSTTRIKTPLIMHTWGESLRKCPSLIDFAKSMYDILEAHRWAVLERNIIHRDISHGNIFVQAEDFKEENEKEFAGKESRPIFVNEIVENVKNADPMARLGDMDNAAELNRDKAVSPSFVARKKKTSMNNEPLRFRTGTPKFIARSPAVGRLLVTNVDFRAMPELPNHLAEKYFETYANDRSGLRTFVDDDFTNHGGMYSSRKNVKKYEDNPDLVVEEFEHHPRHDAESVFWCMVVFLLVAVPLGSPDEVIPKDTDKFSLFCAWRHIANHQVGPTQDICDSRAGLLAGGKLWNEWLHPDLAHAGPLLASLASQVSPEWSLLSPQPRDLHLHKAMQRIILTHIDLWQKNKLDVKFDTGRVRPTIPPDNRTVPQVCITPSIDGQHIAAGALRNKRGSQNIEQKEDSQAKRRRTTRAEAKALGSQSLPPTPPLATTPRRFPRFHAHEVDRILPPTPGSASTSLTSDWPPLDANVFYTATKDKA
ncbi:hypothetical protein PLEOSDRAFT_161809 [Pleurotus ostreatus PC15]|uniref:Fungal-type protein kinase domain-containing protein n=1 Tax=Pleurotus ostreatus (strain PC15) TaxID=1137138 RepID=A0A067ND03_PLEO1|nr:hypothetical protein PLEOSDRAFT_161809 [Pleurotus ostreatus PC15]